MAAPTITIAQARSELLLAVNGVLADFGNTRLDEALQISLGELSRRAHVSRNSITTALAAGTWQSDLSADSDFDDFRPEHCKRLSVVLNNRATWSGSSVSYAVDDMVQGDGSPDSLWYRCTTAHVSGAGNEPGSSGGNTYWTQTTSDVLGIVAHVTEAYVDALHTGFGRIDNRYQHCFDYPTWQAITQAGTAWLYRPCFACFPSATTIKYWPMTDRAYTLKAQYWQPFTNWTAGAGGSTSATVLNIPPQYARPAIYSGAAAYLIHNDPGERKRSEEMANFERLLREIKGSFNIDTGVISPRLPGIRSG